MKVTYRDISASKAFPSGAWDLSTMVRGVRVSMRYFGYTKRQALREFHEMVNTGTFR